ncbi:hypothetical protein RchiOBHm_Chr4g0409211 [Rosa chinensis]|uniref:Uncharacterized protein n=1 Tax=Rosa chinensis TaxID=74649 RepID=A0A2P6QV15_ROSCH|nr:hypothetical protein RchiOBHm_Chr4g0409211 [Rosa chinensis]
MLSQYLTWFSSGKSSACKMCMLLSIPVLCELVYCCATDVARSLACNLVATLFILQINIFFWNKH